MLVTSVEMKVLKSFANSCHGCKDLENITLLSRSFQNCEAIDGLQYHSAVRIPLVVSSSVL